MLLLVLHMCKCYMKSICSLSSSESHWRTSLGYHLIFEKTKELLVPPNPKLFDTAVSIFFS